MPILPTDTIFGNDIVSVVLIILSNILDVPISINVPAVHDVIFECNSILTLAFWVAPDGFNKSI